MKLTLTEIMFSPLLAALVCACAASAPAQETATPTAPRAPAQIVAPRPAARPAPPAGTQTSTPVAKPAPPALVSMPPRQVVTVVHRLSGWKLLAWLATRDPASFQIEELPSATDVHTNIVAGYVSGDGRTVVARLPEGDDNLVTYLNPDSTLFASAAPPARKPEPEFTLVTSDGRKVEAKFVGLDAATGLSLLEASSSLTTSAPVGGEGDTDDPTVGQRVLFYAPAPAPRAPVAAAPPAPAGGGGMFYLNIDEREGRLTEVRSGTSGRPFRLVARMPADSPEWTGAVAANELGEVLGIVSETGAGETQIVPVATMRGALERVMALRASAPQPWLGVRGDAAFQAPLQTWVGFGWRPEAALPLIQSRRGVFLTKVVPGTPAALAGLKAGDLISRIGARDVRGVEDLSLTLKEAGVGSSLDFTVFRAEAFAPLKFTVRLAAAQNPALATAEAESRAVVAAGSGSAAVTPEVAASALGVANSLRAFGLHGLRLTARGATRLGARGGLLVVVVRPGTPAAACGLRAGDVIETANGSDFTLGDLRRMFAERATSPVTLGIVREGARTTLTIDLDDPEDSKP